MFTFDAGKTLFFASTGHKSSKFDARDLVKQLSIAQTYSEITGNAGVIVGFLQQISLLNLKLALKNCSLLTFRAVLALTKRPI